MRKLIILSIVAICIISNMTLAQSQVISDFTTSADSWTIFNTSSGASTAATYVSTGGNPGGFITDGGTPGGGTLLYAEAPAKFKGNLNFSYRKSFSFDLKTSFVGTDNTNGDVVLINATGGVTLYYQLPTKPSTTFSNYTITLDETFAGWHYSSPTGPAPTQVQMKVLLSNVTTFRIRTKYTLSNTFTVTGSMDNFIMNVTNVGAPPIITSFTPLSALPGSTVTIDGSNFNTTANQNIIYFSGVKATAVTATATQLTVKVPVSAPYGPLTAVNLGTGLLGASKLSFGLLFDNNKDFGGRIIPASMSRGYAAVLQNGSETGSSSNSFGGMDEGDIDGDGWVDIITTETGTVKIFAFRNLGSGGTVSTASFATAVPLPSLGTVPGGSPTLADVIVVDVDSDGKPDVVASVSGNLSLGTSFIAVYRNTSSSGTISFATPQFFSLPYYSALTMASGDLDNDGRVDFMGTTGTSPSNLWINQNLSTPGNIDFAYGVVASPASTSGYSEIVVGDLNNDGKPEIIAGGYNAPTLSIYSNVSSPGSISMSPPFTIPAVVGNSKIVITDLDADSRLDFAWGAYGSQYIYMAKNIYTTVLDATAFGPTIQIPNKLGNPGGFTVSDINADGMPDIVISGSSDLGIMQNIGAAGSLSATSFSSPVLFQGSANEQFVYAVSPSIADLDGDNKPEIAFIYTNSGVPLAEKGVFIFHNESFPAPVPTLPNMTGAAGSPLTITGSALASGTSSPVIKLSSIATTINGSPTNTSLSVTPPPGTKSGSLTVTNHGLTGVTPYYQQLFITNRNINATSFGASIDFGLNAAGTTRNALEVADFDDDGKSDVFVVDNGFTGKIFRNTATAAQPVTSSSFTLSATPYGGYLNALAMDIDGDGKTDLNTGNGLLQNSSSSGSISFLSAPNGVNTTVTGYDHVDVADFNKDGKLDMAVTNGGTNITVYENLSSRGTFIYTSPFFTFGSGVGLVKSGGSGAIAAKDFDGDGYEDLIATTPSSNNITIYLNTKVNGPIVLTSFTLSGNPATAGSQPVGITAKDFDGDGKIDIAIAYANSAFVSVYLNTSAIGTISFATPVNLTAANKGLDISSQDLDGDGKAEIVVIHRPNPGPGSFTILKNNSTSGSVNFAAGVNVVLTRNPLALNFSDVNNDSKPDILIVADGGPSAPVNALMVFENKITSNTITVATQPSNAAVCNGANAGFTTSATGTTNIAYQWQFSSSLTGIFTILSNGSNYSAVNTASLTVNTTGNFGAGFYRCQIDGDFSPQVFTNVVSLTVNALPAAPSVTGASGCSNTAITLNATGGTNGQYRWYSVATNGTAIAGQTNSSYTTTVLTATTTYYVSINNGTCESARTAVTATIDNTPCGGSTVINAAPLTSKKGGVVTLDLVPLIVISNGTLDLSSLKITSPPASGAKASINAAGLLTIDYSGLSFTGSDVLKIQACDQNKNCAEQQFTVTVSDNPVSTDIMIFNAVSPNGDGKNDIFYIQNIDVLADTKSNKVMIFNRWGDQVFDVQNYDNVNNVFRGVNKNGNELPTGTYFYKIEFNSGRSAINGFLSLKR